MSACRATLFRQRRDTFPQFTKFERQTVHDIFVQQCLGAIVPTYKSFGSMSWVVVVSYTYLICVWVCITSSHTRAANHQNCGHGNAFRCKCQKSLNVRRFSYSIGPTQNNCSFHYSNRISADRIWFFGEQKKFDDFANKTFLAKIFEVSEHNAFYLVSFCDGESSTVPMFATKMSHSNIRAHSQCSVCLLLLHR